jgi:hypothetical protein
VKQSKAQKEKARKRVKAWKAAHPWLVKQQRRRWYERRKYKRLLAEVEVDI